MDSAVILSCGRGICGEDLGLFGAKVYGGNEQLLRLIIIAQRAGVRRFTVVVGSMPHRLRQKIERDRRITSEINWHIMGTPLKLDPVPHAILQSNVVITPSGLSNIIDSSPEKNEVIALVDTHSGPQVKTENGSVREVFYSGGRLVGVFSASGELISDTINSDDSLVNLIAKAISGGNLKQKEFKDSYWMRLTRDPSSLRKAEELLFSHVSKSSSGWLSKNIHSKFSIPLSRLLIRTPLTPNMISAIIGTIGMLSGLFYINGKPVLGAVFLEIATIFDRCDGEVARVKLMESKAGPWVDTVFDQLSFFSFVLGVPIGYWLHYGSPIAIVLGYSFRFGHSTSSPNMPAREAWFHIQRK
ncbi:MAG: CDP-alcohol phosphatidyltransferase family protein [Candidatus Methanosuratincola sp.]